MIKDSAIQLSQYVTARTRYGSILLFTPSDGNDNYYVPPQEICLSVEEVAKLYEWTKEETV